MFCCLKKQQIFLCVSQMKGKLYEYYILIQILNAKKSNNLIQEIKWKAIYTGLPSSKMWQLISCKLIGTVRQPSVGRNLCCCGFRKSRVDKYELLFRKSLKLSVGNLSGFHCLLLPLCMGTITRSFSKHMWFDIF